MAGAAEADSVQQQRAIVNTVLALSASTVCTFWLSSALDKHNRIRPVDIQNATLAGGVAIGCVANLSITTLGAILIGSFAGLVSCYGFNKIQPYLDTKFGLFDSCGIHNLHGMPSVVGGVASVFVAAYNDSRGRDKDIYGEQHSSQWWRQAVAILLCVAFAIATGTITGYFLKALYPDSEDEVHFEDEPYWEVAQDYRVSEAEPRPSSVKRPSTIKPVTEQH